MARGRRGSLPAVTVSAAEFWVPARPW